MRKLKWITIEHPWYIKGNNILSEFQCIKWNLSIIWPCRVTFNQFELYDWKDIYRFDSLKEAKEFWDNLIK